ncbi:uncharacterized protein LOC114659344 [Erpetoichthys calabaricus]|uniref:uncharacterized protein LOC114659344 n=1 Tax=Erpetoichthys calabaricus TaxID=27687 RepID=UPI0010A07599|nr:uncharacterized protein LOC114659344 [Erpetoichthys calabaricus]
MESTYSAFHSYDFEGDETYQKGAQALRDLSTEHELRMKIFYYSRFIQSVDLEGYRQWASVHLSQPPHETHRTFQVADETQAAIGPLQISVLPVSNTQDFSSVPDMVATKAAAKTKTASLGTTISQPEKSKDFNSDDLKGDEHPVLDLREDCNTLSFQQVFQLIESGQEVPGIKKLNITACNQEPTASQITRRRKPWEGED